MNKIYKVIWSKVRNCYVVVSELAKRNGKCKAAKTNNENEGNLLNGMAGATSLHKAAVALLLAGMIAMPGVSEAKAVSVGYYDPTTDTKPASAGTVTGTDAIGIGTGTAFKVIAQNAIGIGKNVTVGATNNAGDVVVAGNNAIGIGTNVIAKGNNSIANGYGAKANGMDSIALGTNAQALLDDNNGYTDSASKAIAIGYSAQALGDRSIAIGNEAYTNDKKAWAIAIGNLSKSTALGATSVGATAETYGKNSIALGRTAIAGNKDDTAHPDTNYSSISIGYLSKGTAIDAIAMGQSSQVTANSINSIAIGKFSQVGDESSGTVRAAENAIAIGYEARALGTNAVGIGTDTRARTAGAVAIGKDSGLAEIVHTSSEIYGASDLDAGGNSIAIGYGAKNYAANYDAKNQTYANTRNSIAIGSETHTHASYAVSIGANTDAAGDRSLAIGTSDTASNTTHTGARASGQGSIAIGDQAKTRSESFTKVENAQYSSDRARDENANDAMAIGTQAEARATNAIAIGSNASYTYQAGTAVKTIYATHTGQMKNDAGATVLDTRVQGAVVGDGADAAIAIGGATIAEDANGKKLIDTNTGKITLEYNPAHVYGKRSIAIGTGALVETSTAHDALIKLDKDNEVIVNTYKEKRDAFTNALKDYNEKRNAFLKMTPPVTTDTGSPDYDAAYITKYNKAQSDLNDAAELLFGSNGAAKALELASAPYETYMANRKQLLDKDATSVADSIAVGTGAEARSAKSIVLGRKARVNELSNESVAIGEDVLIGKSSSSSIAIGNDTSIGTNAPQSIAIGYQATIGTNNNIVDSIAIGTKAGVFTTTGIAIGSLSQVAGMYSGAIGSEVPGLVNADIKEHNSVAGNYSYAIGNGNKIGKQDFDTNYKRKENDTGTISALKNDTNTARVYVFGARNSVGENSSDEDKTDYVNVIGFKNTVDTTENASVFGEYNTVTKSNHSLIIGKYHHVDNATNSLLIGGHSSEKPATKGLTDVLIYGFEATLKDGIKESVGIGKSVTLKADNAIAIGTGATVEGNNSISIGTGNVVTGANSGAFGDPSTIKGANSYSVGNNNTIAKEKANVFALGNNITSVESDSVFLGSNSAYVATTTADTATTKGTDKNYSSATINGITYNFAGSNVAGVVSVGDVGNERRIQNVAPGLISATSTDAVNGSQLYAVINSGWKVGDNTKAEQATITTNTRQVNYINGVGTTSKVTKETDPNDSTKVIGANIQYDVNTSTITVATDGKVTAGTPDTATTSYFATATTVQNAINNSGWNVTSSAKGGTASNSTTKLVNPGSTVEYVAGSGIKITQEQDGTKTKFTFEADASSGGSGSGSNITDESNKIIKQVTTDKRSTNAYANSDGLWTITTPYIDIHGTADEAGEEQRHWSRAMAERAVAIGRDSKVDEIANDGLAVGTENMVSSQKGLAIGAKNTVGLNADEGMAIGSGNTVTGKQSQAIGSGNTVTGVQSIAIGTGHRVTGSRSGAIGDPNIVNADNSYTVGNNSNIAAGQTDVFAFGNDIKKTTSNSVFLGSNTAYVPEGATTAGMSDYSSATISGKTYNFAGGKPAGVVSVGDVGKERRIQNVAAGKVSPESTDAVNGSQLYHAMNDTAQAVTQDVTGMMHQQEGRLRKGIAGAAALAALHPMDFDPDDKLTFAAGVGNFRGETAAAIGAFYRPDEKVMFSIGGTFGNSENLVNAGISFSLDRRPRVTGSRTAMAKEIVELREQVAQLTALVHQIAGNQGQALPMPPAMYPNTPENKWAYDYIENLQKQGFLSGYAGRELTRNEMAAALDRALASGAKLDERITREFAPELSRIRVVYVNGQVDGEPRTFERPRSSVHEYK